MKAFQTELPDPTIGEAYFVEFPDAVHAHAGWYYCMSDGLVRGPFETTHQLMKEMAANETIADS